MLVLAVGEGEGAGKERVGGGKHARIIVLRVITTTFLVVVVIVVLVIRMGKWWMFSAYGACVLLAIDFVISCTFQCLFNCVPGEVFQVFSPATPILFL